MKEQRKNLVSLKTNVKTITLKIVNHSLARMLVEKFCCDTNTKGITKIHRITLEEHSCGGFYTKLPISTDQVFFFLVVASKLSLYCSLPSPSFSFPVTNDFSISPCATAVLATFFPSIWKLNNSNYQINYCQMEYSLTFATSCNFLPCILKNLQISPAENCYEILPLPKRFAFLLCVLSDDHSYSTTTN